jgi:hypothetical protein
MTLTEQEKNRLREYASILKQYIDPELRQYFPLGWRKRPAAKTREARAVYERRSSLEEHLALQGGMFSWRGQWKLFMAGENESPGSAYSDAGYCQVFPLRSDNKHYLEFLAEHLPKFFEGKRFFIKNIFIPCEGDCSWDCR